MTRFLSLAALLAVTPAFAADAPAPGVPVAGVGVVSADQKLVFVPAKDGGIEALDLASGRIMWSNKAAARLAGAADRTVFAWAGDEKKPNAFRVVALDAETGKTLGKSDPITMPDWASTAKVHGRTFVVAARGEGAGAVVVWQARAFYAGGAAPTEEVLKASMKDAAGVAKVDFKTGKVTAEDRKPKDDEFRLGPAGGANNKVGQYEFRAEEEIPGFKPGAPMVTKLTLTVLKGGKEQWKRELAGNPWSTPPP